MSEFENPDIMAASPNGDAPFDMAPFADFWYQENPQGGGSGRPVSAEEAEAISTVFACVRVLSESIASAPLSLKRWLVGGDSERALTHPLFRLLHLQPNRDLSSFTWREMMVGHLCLRGNCYNEIQRNRYGNITALIPLHPDRMKVIRKENGNKGFIFKEPNGEETNYLQSEILHVMIFSEDGLIGRSPIEVANALFSGARASELYASNFWENDATPGGILATDQKLEKPKKDELRASWDRIHKGPRRARRTAILDAGLKWTSLGMTNIDAQALESRRYSKEEICAIFRVPPHKVMDLSRSTFGNIEHQSIEFVTDSLYPWFQRFNQEFSIQLLNDPAYFTEFNSEPFLLGDQESRAKSNQIKFMNGALTIDEWRARDGNNALPQGMGRRNFVPVNLVPLDRVDQTIDARATTPPSASQRDESKNDPLASVLLESVLTDSAERIAAAFVSTISARIEKAGADRSRFLGWAKDATEKTGAFARKTISPIFAALQLARGREYDAGAIAAAITTGCFADLETAKTGPEFVAIIDKWKSTLAGNISRFLAEATK